MNYVEHLYGLYKELYLTDGDTSYAIPYDVFEIIFKELKKAPPESVFANLSDSNAVGLIVQTKIIMNEYATSILKYWDDDHDVAYIKFMSEK